jgi:hypothetical protein
MSRTVLTGMLLCVFALVGCSALAGLSELQSDLKSAGYEARSINHNVVNGHSTLSIDAMMPTEVPTEEDGDRIAKIVWTTYPADFDELLIAINGRQLMDATPDDLTERFGERPANLGKHDSDSGNSVLVIVVVLVVAVLFAGLIVFLWRRGLRTPAPVLPPSYQQPPQYPSA